MRVRREEDTLNRPPSLRDRQFYYFDAILLSMNFCYGVPLGIGEHHISFSPRASFLDKIIHIFGGQPLSPVQTREELVADLVEIAYEEGKIEECEYDSVQWGIVNEYFQEHIPRSQLFGTTYVLRNHVTWKRIGVCIPFLDMQDRFKMIYDTALLRNHYSLERAEESARELLKEMLTSEQWSSYVCADMFLERGRSGVYYLLRRSRPTIALRQDEYDIAEVLTTLCLHPLAYYTGTWAGVMPPSDEVIAHLALIRGDEHRFWKWANHIPLYLPTSGI